MVALLKNVEKLDINRKQRSLEGRLTKLVDQKVQEYLESTCETLENYYSAVISVDKNSKQNHQEEQNSSKEKKSTASRKLFENLENSTVSGSNVEHFS